jgi:polyferredoxin
MRKIMVVLGLLVMLGGGFVLGRGLTYKKKHELFKVGDFKADFKTTETVPPWIGGLALAAGAALLIAGLVPRK